MHHDGPGTIDDLQEIISPETGYRGGSTESVFQKCLDRHPGALEHMNVQEFVFFRQGASRTGVGRTQYLRAFASGVRGLVIESHGWSRHLFLLSSPSSFLETQMVGRPWVPYSFFWRLSLSIGASSILFVRRRPAYLVSVLYHPLLFLHPLFVAPVNRGPPSCLFSEFLLNRTTDDTTFLLLFGRLD